MSRTKLSAVLVTAAFLAFGCGESSDGGNDDGANQPFVPSALSLVADDEDFVRGEPVQLKVIGEHEGQTREITEGVSFASSNEEVATVDETGLVSVHYGGDVTFTATLGDLIATWEVRTGCDYPKFSPELVYDRIMPPLAWPAKRADGTDFQFDLREVQCSLEWAETKTIAFVISAIWCTPCTLYAQRLEGEIEQLKSMGMEVVIIEAQDMDFLPADLGQAWNHVKKITTNVPGIVAGDADTMPEAGFLNGSAIVRAFPSVFVVRTRDMRIIADQNRADTYLPLQAIAADPEADWSKSGEPSFENNCGPDDDEESGEGNDTPATATPLSPGTIEGGICTDAPDFYQVEIEGAWALSLDFDPSVGDLDVFVWDEVNGQPMQIDNQVIGSATSSAPEAFEHEGPAIIQVSGYQHASAPYTLTFQALAE